MGRVPRARVLLSVLAAGALRAQDAGDVAAAFVRTHCVECHGGDTTKGKLDLTRPAGDAVAELWRWTRLAERVRAGEMPPADAEPPSGEQRAAFAVAVGDKLRAEVPRLPPDPGRVTVRRLSRAQWANCVFDLFGVEIATAGFPADDLGYGFDTIGDALTFSTLHLEHYVAGAREVAAAVFVDEYPDHPAVRRFEAEAMVVVEGPIVDQTGDVAILYTNATIAQDLRLPRDGIYRWRIHAGADQAGDEPAKMRVLLDGRELDTIEVPERAVRAFDLRLPMNAGAHRVSLAFVNDYQAPDHPDPKRRDRNLRIDALEVIGPTDARVVPPAQQWLWAALPPYGDETAKVRALTKVLLARVWRRAPSDAEVARLADAAAKMRRAGESALAARRFVLQTALASPSFLFRAEANPAGAAGTAAPLASTAIATRLSFFLWASAPDAELLALAARGRLADPAVRLAQVDRMLADARADRLATEFAAMWLELRSLAERTPDPARFPGFDDALRFAMRRETELLFLAVLREGRDVRDLLDCDFTFVDARLAAFYGLPAPAADAGFVRVVLPGTLRERGGVLGHASILAVTSNPTRTSPVKRGKWILENLLGQPPPPPPPGNDSLKNEARVDSSRSFREQLAQHRERAECAACHARMDALGFALEHYDAIGRFRAADAGGAIDCTGVLPDGRALDGLASLKKLLIADDAFERTLASKLFVYAVGRDPRSVDRLRLYDAVARMRDAGRVTLRDLVRAIVDDVAFANAAADARR
jgi:hypothetical protein